jgi:hypothetical protein
MLAVIALHVITAAIFLDTNVTFWTIFSMSADVIGSFAIIGTLGKPSLDSLTICRGMIVSSTFKAKITLALIA